MRSQGYGLSKLAQLVLLARPAVASFHRCFCEEASPGGRSRGSQRCSGDASGMAQLQRPRPRPAGLRPSRSDRPQLLSVARRAQHALALRSRVCSCFAGLGCLVPALVTSTPRSLRWQLTGSLARCRSFLGLSVGGRLPTFLYARPQLGLSSGCLRCRSPRRSCAAWIAVACCCVTPSCSGLKLAHSLHAFAATQPRLRLLFADAPSAPIAKLRPARLVCSSPLFHWRMRGQSCVCAFCCTPSVTGPARGGEPNRVLCTLGPARTAQPSLVHSVCVLLSPEH